MTPLEQTSVNYARVGLSNNGKVRVEVNSSTAAEGYSVTETGIVLYNANGVPALELLLENVGGDIKNGKDPDAHYSANIADNGSGVFVHGYVKISDGINEYIKYTYNLYSTLEDVTHAPASGISQPLTVMPLVYKTAMRFTGLASAFYRPALYPIYTENNGIVENNKTIPIYSNGSNLTDYSFEGQCSQDTAPSPMNPVEVEEFGDLIPNICSSVTISANKQNVYLNLANLMVPNNTKSLSLYLITDVPLNGNSIYLHTSSTDAVQITTVSSSNGVVRKIINLTEEQVTAIRTSTTQASIRIYKSDANFENKITNVMLVSGSQVIPYGTGTNYKIPVTSAGQTKNIILSEPLRKIGNYADTVDSEGVVTRKIKKLVFDGTENWQEWEDSYIVNISSDYQFGSAALSTHYAWNATTVFANEQFTIVNAKVWIRDDSQSTLADFTTFLAQQYTNGTPVTIWYVLATPTIEYLPPYNNSFDYKTAYSAYINANGEIEGNAYSVSTIVNRFTVDQIGKSITITAFAKTVLSSRVAIATTINGVRKESNSVMQDNSGLLKITVTPTSTSDSFHLTYGSGSLNNIYSWVGLNKGTNYIPTPTIPTSSGFSNIEIGTNLAPSKFTYDLGKMFVAKGQGKVRVNGEWV